MAATATADEVHRIVSVALDAAFYRAAYPDVDHSGQDPLNHYLQIGWRDGRDPAPWFSSSAYLAANADVRRARIEPLFHFLSRGRREGREVYPSKAAQRYAQLHGGGWTFEPQTAPAYGGGWTFESQTAPGRGAAEAPWEPPEADQLAADREFAATEFDAAYYLGAHPDVAAAGVDPLEHFLVAGWREGRDPTPRFSVQDYLEANPDVAEARVNPFVHYLRAGRAEGRQPRHELGFRYKLLARLKPVAERAAETAAAAARRTATPTASLTEALANSRTGLRDLHITFSHDDYSANIGGVQLCLQREHARVAELGRDHLHLFPADPWPVVRQAGEPGLLGVLWNGQSVGAFPPKVVARALADAAGEEAGTRTFAVHSLLGHAADETADILASAGLTRGYFWLHDFASLCAGFHLLRNDVEDCAAPPPDSAACSVCSYFTHRQRHLEEHRRLFERLDLTVVSPSEPTLQLWRERGFYPSAQTEIVPHARLVERGPAPLPRQPRPFRLAFAGLPAAHKGWTLYRELVVQHADDPRYTFLHLGGQTEPGLPLEFHKVTVSEARPRIMQETLEALDVDAVLIWPLCQETFSFTAYEAVAAGCAVVTGPDSGNVAAFVRDSGHGWVLPSEAALAAAMRDGAIVELARKVRKPRLYDLQFSALSVDLFGGRTGS